jgi:hypothetical protein
MLFCALLSAIQAFPFKHRQVDSAIQIKRKEVEEIEKPYRRVINNKFVYPTTFIIAG